MLLCVLTTLVLGTAIMSCPSAGSQADYTAVPESQEGSPAVPKALHMRDVVRLAILLHCAACVGLFYCVSINYFLSIWAWAMLLYVVVKLFFCLCPYAWAHTDNTHMKVVVRLSFVLHYEACVGLCFWSARTGRLSPKRGLEWEIYFAVLALECGWLLLQAAVARRYLVAGSKFGPTTFAEKSLSAFVPFLADPVDTLKDALFGALCFASPHPAMQCLGVASWLWLAAVHVFLLCFHTEEGIVELSGGYAGVLYSTAAANDPPCGQRTCTELVMPLLVVLYKQTTRTNKLER